MSLTGRKEGRKEGGFDENLSLFFSNELPGPRTVGMRSYPWKTSKLHLERLKLFPLDYARKSSVLVADWLHEYPMIEPCSVCPSSSSSFTANSSIVFCRQQITFRHRYIHPLCEILPPSSFSQHFMHSFFKIARRKKFLDRNYFYSIRKELYIRRREAEEREISRRNS